MKLEGIHHITAITADAQDNIDFYAGVLGLRLVKKTVNQDDPTVYHLFFADEQGRAGSDITFFEFPGASAVMQVMWWMPSSLTARTLQTWSLYPPVRAMSSNCAQVSSPGAPSSWTLIQIVTLCPA